MGEQYGKFKMDLAQLPHGNGVHPDLLDRYINNRLQQMLSSFPWTRLSVTSILQVPAAYTTGTISILNGATTGVLTGGTFTADMQGRRIRIAAGPEFYVFNFVDATNFSIDREYEGDDVTDAGFRIWQAIFTLPTPVDIFRSVAVPRLGIELEQKSKAWLDARDPSRTADTGGPFLFVPADDSVDGFPQIELYPGADTAEGLPIDYRMKVNRMSDAKEEFLDWIDTEVIFAGVEADLYALKGNGAMKQMKEAEFQNGLKGMQDQDVQRMSAGVLQMDPAWTQHRIERAAGGAGKSASWNQNSRWGGLD